MKEQKYTVIDADGYEQYQIPDETRDDFIAYSWDRELDGMSDETLYPTFEDAERASANAYGGTRIWSQRFVRDEDDVFDVHDEEQIYY